MINAHVSVLMDLQAKLPHSIELETDYRDWTQIIEYENKPKLSSLCEIIGHTTKKWSRNKHNKDQGKALAKLWKARARMDTSNQTLELKHVLENNGTREQ